MRQKEAEVDERESTINAYIREDQKKMRRGEKEQQKDPLEMIPFVLLFFTENIIMRTYNNSHSPSSSSCTSEFLFFSFCCTIDCILYMLHVKSGPSSNEKRIKKKECEEKEGRREKREHQDREMRNELKGETELMMTMEKKRINGRSKITRGKKIEL